MCGIVGYVGPRHNVDVLVEGLRRLEYRGYDSAGIATITPDHQIAVRKATGRIENLVKSLDHQQPTGHVGIGHTRWATHGAATRENAHPHIGGNRTLALVHNGVIENFSSLRVSLEADGYRFQSETDSESIAHLLSASMERELAQLPPGRSESPEMAVAALKKTLAGLRGTYGLAVVFRDLPDYLFAARFGSPLVIGIGEGEHFLASDAATLTGYADKIVYMADHQIAVLTANSMELTHRELGAVQPSVEILAASQEQLSRGGHPHFMLKEIFEQPDTVRNAMRGRLSEDDATAVFGGLNLRPQQLRNMNRILLTGCGTSWHAALYGEYLIEELARLPVEVEYASELRYRNPPIDSQTLVFAITQSGETADTLGVLQEMKRKGHSTLAICNVVGSSIAQEADGGVFLHAGPEIGVASTKAFTSQCVVLALLGLYFGRLRHLSFSAGLQIIAALRELPEQIEAALGLNQQIREIAAKYVQANNFLYLGRHYNFPTALEGALKLKEISYIHAEGYPAAEMKHGPIALVDEKTPSVFISPRGWVYDKVLANMQEVRARGGPVIAIGSAEDNQIAHLADDLIQVPETVEYLQPILNVIPLQLLAYHVAVLRGCDVDKPRNLAKSVTVE
jgi:glutamine---fructose-6-phosphate transaminase (isomerizing)